MYYIYIYITVVYLKLYKTKSSVTACIHSRIRSQCGCSNVYITKYMRKYYFCHKCNSAGCAFCAQLNEIDEARQFALVGLQLIA